MKYNHLGNTKVKVSQICLGTMTFGEQNTEEEAFRQMDCALDAGINFFDTAEMYPVPPQAKTCHRTEEIVGNWIKEKKNRDQIILATKVVARAEFTNHVRDGNNCLDRKNIREAIDASLKRLNTDYIDLYQLHWPDRPTNFFGQLGYKYAKEDPGVPIEETYDAMYELVKEGKIRFIGLSNETSWGVSKFLRVAKPCGPIVSIQNPYNLLNRSFEIGLAEFSHRDDVGLLAYSPLGFGTLSGKYLTKPWPENARITKWKRFSRYTNELGVEATKKYILLAQKNNISPIKMALSYVHSRPFCTSTIIGATNLNQLKDNIDSIDLNLSKEILKEIEKIHQLIPNPCP
jgi:aryl-alcohol dehydrogenase-like predicted oxidoreductase